MIFRGSSNNNGWTMDKYETTWHYGYDFMLNIAKAMISEDFEQNSIQIFTAEVAGSAMIERTQEIASCGNSIQNCQSMKQEYGVLRVCGISRTLECSICLDFFNQSNLVRLSYITAMSVGKQRDDFDKYMDAIEIKAHCLKVERNIRDVLSQN